MTFAIDRTRSFLKIEESNLLSLHRSTHPVIPSLDYCQGHLCDAFICVVQEYNLHRVYLALHDQQVKSNFVFVADPIRPDNKKLAALLLEAQGFLENIGFEMEPVNINFSSATREVVIRDIRVMREPSLALQLDAAKIALEGLNAEKKEIIRRASQEQIVLKTAVEDLKRRLIAAAAVQQASMVELPDRAENRAGSAPQFEPDALRKDLGILSEEAEGLRLRLDGAEKELQKVQEELSSVKTMLKSTRESLKIAKDEARQARKEQKHSRHESDLLNEQLKSGQLELDKARDEIEVVRREFQDARKVFEAVQHDRAANNDDVEAAHQAATADLKAEINRLMAELADANVSLSAEKAKIESALQEMDALERNAAAELKLLKKKVDTLTAEKQQLEKITADIKIKAHGEIERQQQVNQSQRKAAIKKLNALKEEIRQLAETRAVIATPAGIPLVQSGNDGASLSADDRKESTFASQQTGFSFDPFGSSEATGFINFLPDKLLKGIPYSVSTDVVEIYRSYNTIHAAPAGKRAQKCDGFVCLVTDGEQSLVYVAWLMNSSGEALICLPELVAEGDDSCQRILREGIGYFERIGFLIDRLPLERDSDKRQIQLDGLAVFCRTVADCAA